jgi:hypothetical protein
MRKRIFYLVLAAAAISVQTGCEPIDLTGLENDLGCMVGSLDNHFPGERDKRCR